VNHVQKCSHNSGSNKLVEVPLKHLNLILYFNFNMVPNSCKPMFTQFFPIFDFNSSKISREPLKHGSQITLQIRLTSVTLRFTSPFFVNARVIFNSLSGLSAFKKKNEVLPYKKINFVYLYRREKI